MNQAFLTGINGVQMHEFAIDNIGNNLANISTTGYRGYTVEFASLFEKAMYQSETKAPNENGVGTGGRIQANVMDTHMGDLMITDSATDLAIDGEGWFGVMTQSGDTLYTRAGSFTFDADRSLVSQDGMYVLGTIGGNIQNGTLTTELQEVPLGSVTSQQILNFPDELTYPTVPTTEVSFAGNLGVSEDPLGMSADIISDDAENAHKDLRLLFTKSEVQPEQGIAWDITAELMSSDGSIVFDTQTGSALFNASGALLEYTIPQLDNSGTPLSVNLGEAYSGVTSVDSRPTTSSSSSNGLEEGALMGYAIGADGNVEASFTNGRTSAVGRVAVFHFINDQGLENVSGTHFRESVNSGSVYFSKDADGNNVLGASIQNHRLESSNVRYEVGMTDLIIMQRSYMANAKCITTGDELIQKALQM